MEKYEGFITNWMSALQIGIVILFSVLFIIAFHLSNPIIIYTVAILNAIVWVYNLMKIKFLIRELLQDRKRWKLAATYDSLTGVLNRGIFVQGLVHEIQRARRYKEGMSFIIFDLDLFKNINDIYGHSVGDEILIAVCDKVKSMIRGADTFGRLGGEEFGIMMPKTDLISAEMKANKIREEISTVVVRDNVKVTASFGVTALSEKDTIDALYERADQTLYTAKESGRNKVSAV